MNQTALFVSFVAFVAMSSGCGDKSQSAKADSAAPLESRTEELSRKLALLEKRVTKLQVDQAFSRLSGPQEVVWFDPQDDKGYQAVQGPAGPLLVVLEKVEPYVDGFTVHMKIGNPTSAGFSGFKGSVKWGRKFDEKKDDAFNELAEKNIALKDYLPAGAWTIVNFNIGPATPDQVRRIAFAPTFDSIQLRSPTR